MAGIVPDAVRLRAEKSDFDATFHESLAGHDLTTIRRLLGASDAEVYAYVQPEVVRRELLDIAPWRYPQGLQAWALYVWRLVTAECWLRFQTQGQLPHQLLASERLQEPRYELVASPA
jgi:hypothetical protein